MKIINPTIQIGRRADGTAAFVLAHGGMTFEFDLDESDRIAIGRALIEPLYECVPCKTETPKTLEAGE